MNLRSFSLKPFPSSLPLPDIKISGEINRKSHQISIAYILLGNIEDLFIPEPSDNPRRKNGLWKETCFEFFIKEKDSSQYWEFNLSPSGDWNVYRFSSYREGMMEEPAFVSLPFNVRSMEDGLNLWLEFNSRKIIPEEHALQMAVSAVVKSGSGNISYWALTHQDTKPDFHNKEGFVINL